MVTVEEGSGSMIDKVKQMARDVQDGVKEKITEVSEAGQEKVHEAIDGVNEILPAIRELGYSVDGVSITLGLIPDISIDVSGLSKTIDDEKYQQLCAQHGDRRLLVGVLKTLQAASAMQQKIGFLNMHSDSASITLGLPPRVSLKFRK